MPPDACRNPIEDDSIGNNNYNNINMLVFMEPRLFWRNKRQVKPLAGGY